jgi:shikimate 5-dehydrogenase
MSHLNYLPIKKPSLKNFNNIVDLTINSNNKLKKVSNKLKIKYIDGYEFALNQALKQFKIYTQKKIDTKTVKKVLKVN